MIKLPRILIVTNGNFFSDFGGGQVYVKNLVDEMINQRLSICIFQLVNSDEVDEKNIYRNIFIYSISVKNKNLLTKKIREFAPDVVHAHSNKDYIASICKEMSIPCIVTAHHGGITCPTGSLLNYKDEISQKKVSHENSLPDVLKNYKGGIFFYPILRRIPLKYRLGLGRLFEKLPFIYFLTPIISTSLIIEKKQREWDCLMKNVDLIIAPSKAIAENMILNGLDSHKIQILPHGIPFSEDIKTTIVDIKNKTVKFFYTGRISYVKGIHILLKAFEQLDQNLCELHLIGDIGNRYAKKLKRKYKSKENIFFHGKIAFEKLYTYISEYHILVHPAIYLEVFGLNISEALYLGKPVIATKCGGPEMQLKNGVNGLLVSPNNESELLNAMNWMIKNPDNVTEMSKMAPLNVISMKEHVNQLTDIYTKIVHTNK